MKIYNTLSRKLEEFIPLKKGVVTFYHCGPTVYWIQHIGNLRGMTMGDLAVRTLRYFGYEVKHVRNYTDVGHLTSDSDTGEDKMEKGAKREGLSPEAIALKYIVQFEKDTKALGLLEPTFKPRATEYVGEMIAMISELLEKGFAYTTELAVYFDVLKFDAYTCLSRQNLKDMASGSGKADVSDSKKRNPMDFALWFYKKGAHKNALQTWPGPHGEGIPGWHIECSAMSRKLLGKTIDIHMGGVEHIPVHHTNEIAQSECANGASFVRYWMHNEHLLVNGKKMAKSEGTGICLDDIITRGFEPTTLRYFYLQAHYRSKQNFTWEALDASKSALKQLRTLVSSALAEGQGTRTMLSPEKLEKVDAYRMRFREALSNDFNIPAALAVLWEILKSNIPPGDKIELAMDFDEVLGIGIGSVNAKFQDSAVPDDVQILIQKRDDARMLKNYDEADVYRMEIEKLGYLIEDSSAGTIVKKSDR